MKALALLALAAAPVMAQPILMAGDGSVRLVLHDDARMCLGDAKYAEFQEPGKPSVGGCWKISGMSVVVSFLDGDTGNIPVTAFQKYEEV